LNNYGLTPKEWVGAKREVKDISTAAVKTGKALILLVCSLVFWGIVSALLVGYIAFAVPCGSSFEGGCGYRVVFFTLIVGGCMTVCLSLITVIGYLLRLNFAVLIVIMLSSVLFIVAGGLNAFEMSLFP
jgi:hypothetical protein